MFSDKLNAAEWVSVACKFMGWGPVPWMNWSAHEIAEGFDRIVAHRPHRFERLRVIRAADDSETILYGLNEESYKQLRTTIMEHQRYFLDDADYVDLLIDRAFTARRMMDE